MHQNHANNLNDVLYWEFFLGERQYESVGLLPSFVLQNSLFAVLLFDVRVHSIVQGAHVLVYDQENEKERRARGWCTLFLFFVLLRAEIGPEIRFPSHSTFLFPAQLWIYSLARLVLA